MGVVNMYYIVMYLVMFLLEGIVKFRDKFEDVFGVVGFFGEEMVIIYE